MAASTNVVVLLKSNKQILEANSIPPTIFLITKHIDSEPTVSYMTYIILCMRNRDSDHYMLAANH